MLLPKIIVSQSGNIILDKNNNEGNFNVDFLPEAVEFMNAIDDKAREKIYYNIKKAQFINDNELLKN